MRIMKARLLNNLVVLHVFVLIKIKLALEWYLMLSGFACTFEIILLLLAPFVLFCLSVNCLDKHCSYDAGKHMPALKNNRCKKIKTEDVDVPMCRTYAKTACCSKPLTKEREKAFENAKSFSKASRFPNCLLVLSKSNLFRAYMMVNFYLNSPFFFH